MGMDVIGQNPKNEKGKYFRCNCWWWRPLAYYCEEVAPEATSQCAYWQSNDADGLDEENSLKLAEILESNVNNGFVKIYEKKYNEYINSLPRQKCELCDGSGVRKDMVAIENEMTFRKITKKNHPRYGETGWCNGCDGIGTKENFNSWYHFSEENVKQFIVFLKNCGGFRIY